MHTHTHTHILSAKNPATNKNAYLSFSFPPFLQADLNLLAFVASVSSRRRCSKDAVHGLLFE